MSAPEPKTISADQLARFLEITPFEVERLTRAGAIAKRHRGGYELTEAVRSYISHLRVELQRKHDHPTQKEIGEHIDINDRNVRYLLAELGIDHREHSLDDIRIMYIRKLRDVAANRATGSLGEERAGLAREQKLLTRIKKQKELGEWAPISALTKVLASTTSQMASTFDSIPVQLKRKWPELSGEQLNIVRAELSQARNLMVATGVEAVRAIALAETEYADEFADAADDDDEPE